MIRLFGRIVLAAAGSLLTALGLLFLWPLNSRALRPPPSRSSEGYATAVEEIARIQNAEDRSVIPICRTNLLIHGTKTEHTYVLLHGYTNCPAQFELLARALHERGHNVLVPRLPHHGYADRLSDDHGALTAKELLAQANRAVNLARGLGRRVTVVGFSMGGLIAAWMAQNRSDLSGAIIISPPMGVKSIPRLVTRPAMTLFRLSPNRFLWWDPEQKDALVKPVHAYPRMATRALAEMLRLGFVVRRQAALRAPQTNQIRAVINPTDEAVDSAPFEDLLHTWQRRADTRVEVVRLDPQYNLEHDFIDPAQPDQPLDLTLPLLLQIVLDESPQNHHGR